MTASMDCDNPFQLLDSSSSKKSSPAIPQVSLHSTKTKDTTAVGLWFGIIF